MPLSLSKDALRLLQEKMDNDGSSALIASLDARLKAAQVHAKVM